MDRPQIGRWEQSALQPEACDPNVWIGRRRGAAARRSSREEVDKEIARARALGECTRVASFLDPALKRQLDAYRAVQGVSAEQDALLRREVCDPLARSYPPSSRKMGLV